MKFVIYIILISVIVACSEKGSSTEDISRFEYLKREAVKDSIGFEKWDSLGYYFEQEKDLKNALINYRLASFFTKSQSYSTEYKIAELYRVLSALDSAQVYYKRCIKIDPTKPDPYLKTGKINIVKGKAFYNEAFESLNSLLRIAKENSEAYYLKGVLYKYYKDTTKAISSFRTAVEINPEYFDPYPELGLLSVLNGDSLGIYYYKNGLEVLPQDYSCWYGLAWAYHVFDRLEASKKEYKNILMAFPNSINSKFNLGTVHMELGELDSAKWMFSNVLNQNPEYIDAQFNMYQCLKLEGEIEEAKQYKRNVLALDSSYAF